MYLRVSSDDDGPGDSSSITSQQSIIKSDIKKRFADIPHEIHTFKDDGYTGTNFNRPGVIELLKEVKRGQINCIMVKDLSRFGRNYIDVGYYLENIFPCLDIRFIAVNDNYDSSKNKWSTSNLDMPFRNLIYDLYSKDLSRKILSSRQANMEKGKISITFAPYGYLKDTTNKYTLKKDAVAAKIVKSIFKSVINGKSTGQIAKELNKKNILTPMMYKRSKGIENGFNAKSKTNIWTSASVRNIIKDERYTGKYIAGKQKRRIADNKRTIILPKDQWVVIEDRLPVIVSQEIFDAANEIVTKDKAPVRKTDESRLFDKKIRCECCNLYLRRREREPAYYFCSSAKFSDTDCFKDKVYEKIIAFVLLRVIKTHCKNSGFFKQLKLYENKKLSEISKEYTVKIKQMEDKLKQLELATFELFVKYSNDKIDITSFIKQKNRLDCQISSCKSDKERALEFIRDADEKCKSNYNLIEACDVYNGVETLTKELIDLLIEEIVVCKDGTLDVKFTYRKPFEKQTDFLLP